MAHEEIWKNVLSDIELQTSKANFVTWFRNTSILDLRDKEGEVSIAVPNGFVREWLQNKYTKSIISAFRNSSLNIKHVNYVVAKPSDAAPQTAPEPFQKKRKEPSVDIIRETQPELKELRVDPETNLNPRYTFSNFIVGSFNELAHGAIQSALQQLGSVYNPIFVHGGVGLGKTHLIQAFGSEAVARYPSIKVKYITSEKFMNELLDAYQQPQKMDLFKERYRMADIFIVDDIQFIARTERMQEDFFHTYNALFDRNKQIILASDRPPQALSTLEERSKSRVRGGLVVDIGMPDFETRILVLKMKAQEKNFALADDIIEYIAQSIKTNIRELEGALNRLIINSKISNAPLTLEEAKKLLNATTHPVKKFTTPKKIIKAVAEFYDIKEQELINQSRKQHFVKPRQIVMYLLRSELASSYPSIGEYLGGRDHSTVIHACTKIDGDIKNNLGLEDEIKSIKERIYKL